MRDSTSSVAFAPDRVFWIVELFEAYEPYDIVFSREAFHRLQPMLGDPPDEIVGDADVERPSDPAGKNVDVDMLPSITLEYWMPRFRGA